MFVIENAETKFQQPCNNSDNCVMISAVRLRFCHKPIPVVMARIKQPAFLSLGVRWLHLQLAIADSSNA